MNGNVPLAEIFGRFPAKDEGAAEVAPLPEKRMSLESAASADADAESPLFPESPLAVVPTERERFAAVLAHVGTLFAWFLAPLVVYLLKRGDSRWVEHHALQSLLWSLAGTGLAILTCGLAVPVFLVFHIVAALRLWNGRDYDYPVVGDFSRGFVGMPGTRPVSA